MFSTLKIEQAKARIVSLSALIGESGVVKVVAVDFSFPFTGEGFTYTVCMYRIYIFKVPSMILIGHRHIAADNKRMKVWISFLQIGAKSQYN